jgi:hypothetical protein
MSGGCGCEMNVELEIEMRMDGGAYSEGAVFIY